MVDAQQDNLDMWHVSEAGFSRVMTRLDAATDAAILTGYRAVYTKEENEQRNREMRADFNAKKLGSYGLIGSWDEEQKDGKKITVSERSMLVINTREMPRKAFQDVILAMIKKYDQDAAVIKEDDTYFLLFKDGSRDKIGTKVGLNKIGGAYSRFVRKKNVPFKFEGVLVPTTIVARQIADRQGILYPLVEASVIRSEALRKRIAAAV